MSDQVSTAARDNEWVAYYERFTYFSPETVHDGCHPRIMEHPKSPQKAIVLVHGLSDSSYFMTAIGDYFFNRLGLREPNGMEGVELEEWKSNVNFAVNTAAAKASEVSIGGLSTGGTLGLYMAAINPKIRDTLYLFSAALDLAGGSFGLIGGLKEKLLLTFLTDLLDFNTPLIGENPYRYSSVDMDGAEQLARLIKETGTIIALFDSRFPFPEKVFAAHSEFDSTADIASIEALQNVSDQARFNFFRIPKNLAVPHVSVVLDKPIEHDGKELEARNPLFPEMMQAIAALETIG